MNPDPGGNDCDPGKVYTQQAAQIPFIVPSAGVITAWATRANGNAGQQAALKTLRQTGSAPGGEFSYSIQGSSALQALTPNAVNRFATRIAVQAGDKLGYFFPSGPSQACRYTDGSGSDDTRGGPSSGQPGSSFNSVNDDFSSTKFMNLEATIEVDADGDGFGDETQDRCLGSGGPSGGCPAGTNPTGPGGGTDTTKPALRGLSFSRTVFKAAGSGGAFTSQKGRKRRRSRAPTGTKVSFRLTEAASVRFTVQRKTSGRRVRSKCRAKTRKNAKRRKCTRWKNVRGSFTVPAKAGKTSFTFRGRIGGRKLRTGSYRLSATAKDPARNASLPKRKGFRIVR
ncbi:MAG TPA: hypothetical protein VEX39_03730 [Thermoleophilaceae bacterium]|nr:hypothetical protein [Thermoleophilaceae bacterium]